MALHNRWLLHRSHRMHLPRRRSHSSTITRLPSSQKLRSFRVSSRERVRPVLELNPVMLRTQATQMGAWVSITPHGNMLSKPVMTVTGSNISSQGG